MLVTKCRLNRARSDDGAVLVTVVVVMLVGFIVATVVAAAVMFTISSNVQNTDRTQAYVSAESGRDAAKAMLDGTCVSATGTGTDPDYDYDVYAVTGTEPDSSSDGTLACPTEDTDYVVIRSVGTAPDGSQATIESVYPWEKRYEQQTGGVLAYFAGGVTSTVSNYTGDLVVRTGDFSCNNDATLNGDLYVVEGTFSLSRDCTINGSVYVQGNANNNSHGATVTGLLKSGGDVTLSASGTTVGTRPASGPDTGGIEAVGTITLGGNAGTGNVYGVLRSAEAIPDPSDNWAITPVGEEEVEIPEFDPPLPIVKAITAWIHLDGASAWNATPVNACTLTTAQLTTLLSTASADRTIVDYRPCTELGNHVYITIDPVAVQRDVVFIVPAAKRLDVSFNGTVSGSERQLVFIHEDGNRDDRLNGETRPTCSGTIGNDRIDIPTSSSITTKLMFYTPCGMTGNVRAAFTGQLYTNESSINFGNGASYTCAVMSWPDAFEKLGCRLRGEGDDAVITTVLVQGLGRLLYQSEV